MNNKALHLLNIPANVPESAFSLMSVPINGIRSLTSLDHRAYFDANLIQGRNIVNKCIELLGNSCFSEFMLLNRLPAANPLRMRYYKLIVECAFLVDMLRRLDNLIGDIKPEKIIYYGEICWRSAAIQSLCAIRGISFYMHQPYWIKIKKRISICKKRILDIGNWMNNHLQCSRYNKADYLFFLAGANRFSQRILNIASLLPGEVRIIDVRYNRLRYFTKQRIMHFEGEYPIIRRRINLLESYLHELTSEKLSNSDIIWEGIPLGFALSSLIADGLLGVVAEIQTIFAILEANPDAIVVATPNSEPLLEVARSLNRLVVVQTIFLDDYQWFLPGRGKYIVSSNAHVDYMANLGLSRQDIIVCGNPYYDQFSTIKLNEEGKQIRKNLSISDNETVILFAEDYPAPPFISIEEWEERIREIYKGLSMVRNVVIIVKLHPAPDLGSYNREYTHRRIAESSGISNNRLHILKDILIAPVISACDLMVMTVSSTGEEAILLDKPLISFFLAITENLKYTDMGAALPVRNSEELTNAVLEILQNSTVKQKLTEGRARYRARYFHAQDGKVADRIIKVLEENRIGFLKKQKAGL